MNRAKVGDIKKAVAKAVGFVPRSIEVGERAAKWGGYSINILDWAPDADLVDALELGLWTVKQLDYSKGAMLDLYVHNAEELYTNVTVVIASDGEVLTAYDSVTSYGTEYDNWWLNTLDAPHHYVMTGTPNDSEP